MFEVSLFGVGTVLRLERDALSMVKRLSQATSQYGPPASRAVLGRMQLTLHATRRIPHGASRLVQAVYAIRRSPSRHCGDARVYDHTTPPLSLIHI